MRLTRIGGSRSLVAVGHKWPKLQLGRMRPSCCPSYRPSYRPSCRSCLDVDNKNLVVELAGLGQAVCG